VASAGPYASLHPTTQFFTGWMPLNYAIKFFKNWAFQVLGFQKPKNLGF